MSDPEQARIQCRGGPRGNRIYEILACIKDLGYR